MEELGASGQEFLLRETGCADLSDLQSRLTEIVEATGQAVDHALSGEANKPGRRSAGWEAVARCWDALWAAAGRWRDIHPPPLAACPIWEPQANGPWVETAYTLRLNIASFLRDGADLGFTPIAAWAA